MKVETSELVSLDQNEDGVMATIKHENGETESVRAKIVYGADGAKGRFIRAIGCTCRNS